MEFAGYAAVCGIFINLILIISKSVKGCLCLVSKYSCVGCTQSVELELRKLERKDIVLYTLCVSPKVGCPAAMVKGE